MDGITHRCITGTTGLALFRAARTISAEAKRKDEQRRAALRKARAARKRFRVKKAISPEEKRKRRQAKRVRNDKAVLRARAQRRVYDKKDAISSAIDALTPEERAALTASPLIIGAVEKMLEALLFDFTA